MFTYGAVSVLLEPCVHHTRPKAAKGASASDSPRAVTTITTKLVEQSGRLADRRNRGTADRDVLITFGSSASCQQGPQGPKAPKIVGPEDKLGNVVQMSHPEDISKAGKRVWYFLAKNKVRDTQAPSGICFFIRSSLTIPRSESIHIKLWVSHDMIAGCCSSGARDIVQSLGIASNAIPHFPLSLHRPCQFMSSPVGLQVSGKSWKQHYVIHDREVQKCQSCQK